MTRGAGQWGALPGPSLLRAFAAPAASREPRGVSAEERRRASAAPQRPAGRRASERVKDLRPGPRRRDPGARPPPPAPPAGPQDRRAWPPARCAPSSGGRGAAKRDGRVDSAPGAQGVGWDAGGAGRLRDAWPGARAAVAGSSRVSEEMLEERCDRGVGQAWESDPPGTSAPGPSCACSPGRPALPYGGHPAGPGEKSRRAGAPPAGGGEGGGGPVVEGLLSVTEAAASRGGGAGIGLGAQRAGLLGSTKGSGRGPHAFLSHARSHTRPGTPVASTRE